MTTTIVMVEAMNLGAWKLARVNERQHEKASKLGVSQQAISNWEGGNVIPQGAHLIRAEQEYGIPLGDWLEPAPEEPVPDTEPAPQGAS